MPPSRVAQQDVSGRWYFFDRPSVFYQTIEEAIVANRDAEFVADAKAANQKIWDGINELVALQRQWNALDYGNTLAVDGVVAADVGAVVFGTADAMAALLAAGHATNMAKLL